MVFPEFVKVARTVLSSTDCQPMPATMRFAGARMHMSLSSVTVSL
jgi:hypothetical protein